MIITNTVIWAICISIITFISILWFVVCYIGICRLRRQSRDNVLPVICQQSKVKICQSKTPSPSSFTAIPSFPSRKGNLNAKRNIPTSAPLRYWTIDRPHSSSKERSHGSYQRLRRTLRERGQLFEDADFPACQKSIFISRKSCPLGPLLWMRPHEMCARPKFISEETTRFDVEQGELGDGYLLQGVSSLTLTPKFLDRVVPPDQAFDHSYCGIFRFRFWVFGEWTEVVVDDKLPTHKGRLVFLHSSDPSEFWAALLEKAYAKLYGSYEALQNGLTTRALQDLTGGIVQSFSLGAQDRFLTYQVLNSAVPRSTLLVASINMEREQKRQLRLRNGLVTQHAYSITGLARVRSKMGETTLVRLRNPWGHGEWTGPWSERSVEWHSLTDRDKEILSMRVRNEGEFWMSFDSFARHFTHLDLVHIGPDDWMTESALHCKKPWRAVLARRRWRAGYNAGGGPEFVETTSYNPQFHVQIPRGGPSKCHVVVSVTQQYQPPLMSSTSSGTLDKRKKSRSLQPIGFSVYEVPANLSRVLPSFVSEHPPLDVTAPSHARETVTFFTLPPGEYIVVPHSATPNCNAKFLLRILTDEQSHIWEVNEDNMVFRSMCLEGFEEMTKTQPSYRGFRSILSRTLQKFPPELDITMLHKFLKSHWKYFLSEKPSLELAKCLVMLRDFNISGRIALVDLPELLFRLQFWRSAFLKFSGQGIKTSSYNLRPALWEAGVTVSNKVLECLVLRFAKNQILTSEAFIMATVRLHLAHERFYSIESKMKANPLSLEESLLAARWLDHLKFTDSVPHCFVSRIILMTTYS